MESDQADQSKDEVDVDPAVGATLNEDQPAGNRSRKESGIQKSSTSESGQPHGQEVRQRSHDIIPKRSSASIVNN